MTAPSLKEQQQRLRDDVILAAVNELLARKGYDAMTVDEVATQVGLTKPSLYKHYGSKEALAAAALIRLLDQTLATIAAQLPSQPPIERLRAVLRWALEQHLRRAMPLLPATRSGLRESLLNNSVYLERLQAVSGTLSNWIAEAQADGSLSTALPSEVMLYTLYARTCDPVLEFLQAGGNFSDAEVVDLVLITCFDGLRPRPAVGR